MSSSTDPGTKSAAQIEREVEGTRARLTNTIEELRERVSPGQMMEEAVSYFRGSGGTEFVQNLGRQLRDNPMPALLIGAGIAWMVMGSRSSSSYTTPSYGARSLPAQPLHGQPMGPETSRLAGAAAHRPSGAAHAGGTSSYEYPSHSASSYAGSSSGPGIGERVAGTLHDVRDSISGLAERAGEAASAAWDSVTGTAGQVHGRAGDAAYRASEAARYHAMRAQQAGRSGMDYVMHDQPLILGALGLAVGAAIGALVPNTEAEDRLMGETRDRLAEEARRLAEQGYEQARDVASQGLERAQGIAAETYQHTKERLDESGYSIERGSSALGEVARELRETISQSVQEVTEEVKGAAEQAKEKVGPSTETSGNQKPPAPPHITRL